MKQTLIFFVLILLPTAAVAMDKIIETKCFFMMKPALNAFANMSHSIPVEGTTFEGNCDIRLSIDDEKNWRIGKDSVIVLYEDGWLGNETGHFFYLHKDQNGTFTAFWNGGGYSSHAHTSLNYEPFEQETAGDMKCWENKVAKICFSEEQLDND